MDTSRRSFLNELFLNLSTYKEQLQQMGADKHVKYIISVEKKNDSFESVVMEHLRMNGAHWGLTTLDLLR
ncbi:hypothetical protein LWI29_030521 [Acer saccharum]|uniref:Uncharacterized protein n=1 Tax=Acer saccharum TaxID=4024 RepID=A0AA39SAF3_ACESA|nr:hypothetical protein LWI29_030521 [Acer saccharum]